MLFYLAENCPSRVCLGAAPTSNVAEQKVCLTCPFLIINELHGALSRSFVQKLAQTLDFLTIKY